MSKIDRSRWQNPFTQDGLRVPHRAAVGVFQIHEIGVMALDTAWSHTAVCSPFWRLFYEFGEGAWVRSGGRRVALDAERVAVMPEGVPFDCGADRGVEHLWVHFSVRAVLPPAAASLHVLPLPEAGRGLAGALREATTERRVERGNHLGQALLHAVFADWENAGLSAPEPRLQRVLTYIMSNLTRRFTNQDLSQHAGLGVEAFIRWFRQRTGRTPAAYVSAQRMQEASRRLALSDQSIDQVAEELGYTNRHHFSRVFARHAGCGPAAFRRGGLRSGLE